MTTRAQPSSSSEGIDNFQLPKALVTRIAKSALPHDAKLQKDTINALVNGATVFINYLAATAQDVASSRSRKTIAGPDILKALEIIELGDLVPLLEGELETYRSIGKADKSKGKVAELKGKGKGKGKEPSSTGSATINAEAHALFLVSQGQHEDHQNVPARETLENAEEREGGGNHEDVGMALDETEPEAATEARDDEEEEQQEDDEEEEEEEEEADEDVEDDDVVLESEEVVDSLAIEETELQKDQQSQDESL